MLRSKHARCPLLSCSTSSKVKKLRHLPGKWNELATNIKDILIAELRKFFSLFFSELWIRMEGGGRKGGGILLLKIYLTANSKARHQKRNSSVDKPDSSSYVRKRIAKLNMPFSC
jgi:hypothetical protein